MSCASPETQVFQFTNVAPQTDRWQINRQMDRYYVERQSKEFELCKINIQKQ